MTTLPRSWLFTPGSRPDRFARAAATSAEALILDLEDAVAEDGKDAARAHIVAFLDSRPAIGQQIAVRINPLRRAVGLADLASLARLARGPDIILIPKAEEPGDIALVADMLADAGSGAGLVALVESARGVAQAAAIAGATPRLRALMFGAADYAADMGQQVDRFRPDFARASIANAAAAGGIGAIDSPCFVIDQPEILEAECVAARGFGFHAKAAIHPAQLAAIGQHFAPTAADQEQARRILAAAPDGVGVLEGRMIDIAMLRWARRMV